MPPSRPSPPPPPGTGATVGAFAVGLEAVAAVGAGAAAPRAHDGDGVPRLQSPTRRRRGVHPAGVLVAEGEGRSHGRAPSSKSCIRWRSEWQAPGGADLDHDLAGSWLGIGDVLEDRLALPGVQSQCPHARPPVDSSVPLGPHTGRGPAAATGALAVGRRVAGHEAWSHRAPPSSAGGAGTAEVVHETGAEPEAVVVAVGNDPVDSALEYAAAEALRDGCGLHVLHAVHVTGPRGLRWCSSRTSPRSSRSVTRRCTPRSSAPGPDRGTGAPDQLPRVRGPVVHRSCEATEDARVVVLQRRDLRG